MSDRFHLVSEVSLILIRDGKVCLLRRFKTGYEDGKYALPAGHKEEGETITQALIREAKEEIGIEIDPADLEFAHVVHRKDHDERMSFFFHALRWKGEPENREPEKCDDLQWYALDALPEDMVPFQKHALERHMSDHKYSEFGF